MAFIMYHRNPEYGQGKLSWTASPSTDVFEADTMNRKTSVSPDSVFSGGGDGFIVIGVDFGMTATGVAFSHSVLNDRNYESWESEKSDFLWLYGNPGAGKLSMVDKLPSRHGSKISIICDAGGGTLDFSSYLLRNPEAGKPGNWSGSFDLCSQFTSELKHRFDGFPKRYNERIDEDTRIDLICYQPLDVDSTLNFALSRLKWERTHARIKSLNYDNQISSSGPHSPLLSPMMSPDDDDNDTHFGFCRGHNIQRNVKCDWPSTVKSEIIAIWRAAIIRTCTQHAHIVNKGQRFKPTDPRYEDGDKLMGESLKGTKLLCG